VRSVQQKLLKLASPKSNIQFQTGFDDSSPGPEKNLNFASPDKIMST